MNKCMHVTSHPGLSFLFSQESSLLNSTASFREVLPHLGHFKTSHMDISTGQPNGDRYGIPLCML